MISKNIHIVFLFFLANTLCFAQGDSVVVEKDTFDNYRLHKLWELGVSANAYKGDLSDNYGLWSSSMHLGLKFAKKKRWNGHFNFSIGNIRGENYAYEFSNTTTPNQSFRTNLVTFQFDLQYNFLKTKHWIGHIGQGIGLMRFLPKNENNVRLQNELQTRAINEVYGNITAIFPTSVAITYLLKNGYGVGMNVTWLRPTTDYLDNISLWGTKQGNDKATMVKFYVSVPAWKIRKFLRLEDNIKPTSR